MRLVPNDIYNKEFRRALSGYQRGDVDAFLEEVARDYESLTRENLALKQQVEELGKRLADYARLEESIRKALVLAESTAEEARAGARREGEVIRQEARQEAAQILADARARAGEADTETARVRQQHERFVQEFTALLHSHLAMLEKEARGDRDSE